MFPAACILCAVLVAAEDPTFRPLWKAGDEFTVEVVRKREDSRRPQANGFTTTIVSLRVLEAGKQGSVVDWTPGAVTFSNPEAARNPLVVRSMEALKGLHLELVLNEDGNYAGLRNESAVAAQLQKAMEAMLQESGNNQQLESIVRQLLNPKLLITSAAREAQMYFVFGGIVLKPGFEVELPMEQESPLGGAKLKSTVRFGLTKLSPSEAQAVMVTKHDAATLKAMTESLIQRAGTKPPEGEVAALPPIQLTDDSVGTLDLALGVASNLVTTRRVSLGDQLGRLDEWKFRLLKRPSR
jgi:hypothetical protein